MTIATLAAALLFGAAAQAQTTRTGDAAPPQDNAIMVSIFFKHDQSRPLAELNAQLERQVSRWSAGT
jgi:hypothetical protein